jgi:hypothetical protein
MRNLAASAAREAAGAMKRTGCVQEVGCGQVDECIKEGKGQLCLHMLLLGRQRGRLEMVGMGYKVFVHHGANCGLKCHCQVGSME